MFMEEAPKSGLNVARTGDVSMMAKPFVADMQRRTIMNLIVLGGVSVPLGWLLFGFVSFFIPPGGGSGGALIAKDAKGNVVTFEGWLKDNEVGSRKLVQGIRGDATYLIVTEDKKIEDYALNAVCTHLGCVVPWNRAQKKFMCPCHGSQYDSTGKVVRGPAPLSLALAHVGDDAGTVTLSPWTEQDFRTGLDPWWKP
jgi:cytochrome b6-f complex iron-sulfur subunit